MYEAAVKDALYSLIDDNKSTLLSGITQQGRARQIQLVKETLAPLQYAYYVSLAVGAMRTWEETGIQSINATVGAMRAEYDCEIEVFEYAHELIGDAHAYELAGKDFDQLVARLLKLIREQSSFTSSVHGTHTFKLRETMEPSTHRRIDVDVTDLPAQTRGGAPAFFALLSFTLEERCLDLTGAA